MLCWNVRGLNSETDKEVLELKLRKVSALLFACKKQNVNSLINEQSESFAPEDLIILFIRPLLGPLVAFLCCGILVFSLAH